MAPNVQNPTIVMTPPTQPGKAASPHPRRPPAHRSVSLKHSPPSRKSPKESDTSSDNSASRAANGKDGANNASKNSSESPSSLQPLGRDSSGESSNAEQWFQKSNNDVHDSNASFADNDPPFFMRNSSSSQTPPEGQGQYMRSMLGPHDGSHALPLRAGLLQLGGTDGSSTEDYRGVIDDLTIENKTLKRRLKKYEKLHDSHLKDEKLFEVRIHGLAPHKKRELEETLRRFASSLEPGGFPDGSYEGIIPALTTQKTASSQTQASDSAYASMSGKGSGRGHDNRPQQMASSAALRKQNIHTYLHHIPEGLLPQANPTNMSERAKKKLVVRRMEQIFAGKGAMAGLHQHPIQQQEVSQSAARADRAATEAQGQHARQEGTREARIMAREGKEATSGNTDSYMEEAPINDKTGKTQAKATMTSNAPASSEQRPTRPLDLDPHRAQVPIENIEYMRHLGFSPPNPEDEDAKEGHGWVYLNLLINLAQLHTISVTSDFVRKALGEYSSKFEISNDGRKVRWKGGSSVTRTSSSGGESPAGLDTPNAQSPRKRPKLSHRVSNSSAISNIQQSRSSTREGPNSKLVYTPLFYHKDSTDDGDVSSEEDADADDDDDDASPYPMPGTGQSSRMTSSGRQTAATKKRKKRDDGPIIFYSNARFCTDLSGDRKTNGNANAPTYTPVTSEPVGRPHTSTYSTTAEKRGPLAEAFELPEPMDLGDNPIPESLELTFVQSPLPSSPGNEEASGLIDLPVTGIGGVWPADNFEIEVVSRRARIGQAHVGKQQQLKSLPLRFAPIFGEADGTHKERGAVHTTVIATHKRNLMPSQLPAALCYMPYSEDSTGDDTSDNDDRMSVVPESPDALPPATAPQPVELHYVSSEYEDDDSEAESDTSLDLLAAARQIDPEAVRQQEREYDAQYAERLAEEIPAGSSAATAGGGSGFASPNDDMSPEDYQKAAKASRRRRAIAALKRRETCDSMHAIDPREFSEDEGEDESEDDDTDMESG